jgi:peroxiredoxin (alkyl hydroperoxide reductase subunit C)
MIEPGTQAPYFKLPDQDGNEVSLDDLKGRTSVLVFYPADFSPVCTDQLNVYQEVLADLNSQGCDLYGVSVDGAFCHKAFQNHLNVTIPLLADFHPKGEVARAFGVYRDQNGFTERALVMLDADGVVRWTYVSPTPLEMPGANLIFDALSSQPV